MLVNFSKTVKCLQKKCILGGDKCRLSENEKTWRIVCMDEDVEGNCYQTDKVFMHLCTNHASATRNNLFTLDEISQKLKKVSETKWQHAFHNALEALSCLCLTHPGVFAFSHLVLSQTAKKQQNKKKACLLLAAVCRFEPLFTKMTSRNPHGDHVAFPAIFNLKRWDIFCSMFGYF